MQTELLETQEDAAHLLPPSPPTTCVAVVSLLIQETRSRRQYIFTGFQSCWGLCKDRHTYCLIESHS